MVNVGILFLSICMLSLFVDSTRAFEINTLEDLEKYREEYNSPVIINSTVIPLVDYGYLDGKYIGPQLNPVTIASSAIKDFKTITNSNYTDKERIIKLLIKADWILTNAKDIGNYSILEYKFDFPARNMEAPWISAMGQAKSLQALIKAHNITNDTRYLNLSEKILNSFFVNIKDGGITYKDDHGWWYEEYPSPQTGQEYRVLNGMGWTLLGLHEYFEYTNSSKSKYLFDKGFESFVNNLPKYDNGVLSYYDAAGKPADEFYHKVHLEILEKLYLLTENAIIKQYYDNWKSRIS